MDWSIDWLGNHLNWIFVPHDSGRRFSETKADDHNAVEEDAEVADDGDRVEDIAESSELVDGSNSADLPEWEKLHVCESILKALKELKYATPTAIQEGCLPPAIRSRKDIIGAAETGSGKTLAFAIPVLQNILEDKQQESADKEPHLRALIITPTRELAVQIKRHIAAVGKYTDISTCLVVGGMFKVNFRGP